MDIWRGRADVGIGLAVCKRRERQDPISKAAQQGLQFCAVVVVVEGGVWVCVIKLTILHQSCTGGWLFDNPQSCPHFVKFLFFFFLVFLFNVYERGTVLFWRWKMEETKVSSLDLFIFPVSLLYIATHVVEPHIFFSLLALKSFAFVIITSREKEEEKSQVFLYRPSPMLFSGGIKFRGHFSRGLTSAVEEKIIKNWLKRLTRSWQTMSHTVHEFRRWRLQQKRFETLRRQFGLDS